MPVCRTGFLRTLTSVVAASLIAVMMLPGCASKETRCVYWPEEPVADGCGPNDRYCSLIGGAACPRADQAKGALFECDEEGTIDRGPTRKGDDCCYDITVRSVRAECKLN